MTANARRRLSRAERMDRITEMFRHGGNATVMNGNAAPPSVSRVAVNADIADPPPADAGGLRTPATPGWFRKSQPDGPGDSHRPRSDFSHLHRRLAAGEPIPRAPDLLDQIKGLSQLLAQRPLSQQEEEALRGEEDDVPGGPGTQVRAEEEDEAFA